MPPAAPRDPDLEALAAQNARVRSLALAIARDAPPGGRPGSRCLGSVAAPSPRRPEQPVGLVGEGQRNFLRHSARDEAHRKDRELVAAEFLEDCSADRCRERLHRPILDAVSELKEPSRRVLPPDGGGAPVRREQARSRRCASGIDRAPRSEYQQRKSGFASARKPGKIEGGSLGIQPGHQASGE